MATVNGSRMSIKLTSKDFIYKGMSTSNHQANSNSQKTHTLSYANPSTAFLNQETHGSRITQTSFKKTSNEQQQTGTNPSYLKRNQKQMIFKIL